MRTSSIERIHMAKKRAIPPKVVKRETKSKKRLFRFSPSNGAQLEFLSERYGADVSKVFDILIESSRDPAILGLLDRYIAENYSD